MNPLLEQFLSEAREALEGIGEKLMALEEAPGDQELMTHLFRLVHTLKGNSGLFEFPEMTRVLHAGEDLMDAVRNGNVKYSQTLADRLLEAMDFIGMLCDDLEAERATAPSMAAEAVKLAQSLRELVNADVTPMEETVPSEASDAVSDATSTVKSTLPGKLDAAWLARVPEAILKPALEAAKQGTPLVWLHYTPNDECFFQGEDPLHQAKLTPGFLWGGITARAPWPALADMDAYRCMLNFDVLAAASADEVLAHYRYMPEQVQIFTVTPPVATPVVHTDLENEALQNLLEVQREVLSLPDDAQWLAGRIKAAVATLAGCLRASGRAAEIETLNAIAQGAIGAATAAPLAAWMERAFPVQSAELVNTAEAGAAATAATVITAPEAQPKVQPEVPTEAPPELAPQVVSEVVEGEVKFGRRAEDANSPKTLKVEQVKIDRLMNLIGEMVVAKNAIPYLANRAETVFGVRELSREIKAQYAVINRISEEMQDAIMQVRMMPVSFVFQRFPRLVRDTSRRLGKEVNLVLEGQDTAADKNIIESLGDLLVHIVRNSLDHGLEMPQVRTVAGKPAIGTLKIAARQESDRVLIEISDDGKGIDPEVVKHKAYQKGLIDEQALDRISDQEAVNLVFLPGFSTAEVVSDLSGRGVGMDVVRTGVEQVNGSIVLDSVKGKGTVIRISLPLSMAVTSVMTVESDGQMFGVPMDSVVETVRVPRAAVRTIKQSMATVLRDRIIPLKSLNSILGLASPPLCNDNDELAALIVRIGDEPVGILVDDFHETADIILKPLGGVLAGMRSYSGSALMGDGSVLMVLNIKEMLS